MFPGTPTLKVRSIRRSRRTVPPAMVEFNTHMGTHMTFLRIFTGKERYLILPAILKLHPARYRCDAEDVPLRLEGLPDDLGNVEALLIRRAIIDCGRTTGTIYARTPVVAS